MTSKAYTRATRTAAGFLAKLNRADAAATAFGIDPRTVRSSLTTVEIPDDKWTAIRDVLLARGAEMAALGKTAGLPVHFRVIRDPDDMPPGSLATTRNGLDGRIGA
jgi:hypothetical protein